MPLETHNMNHKDRPNISINSHHLCTSPNSQPNRFHLPLPAFPAANTPCPKLPHPAPPSLVTPALDYTKAKMPA